MSNKVPGVFYPNIHFGCCGNSENGYGVGSFSIGAALPNGNQMDIADILFQHAPISRYNELDAKVKGGDIGDALTHRSSIDRRLSKKQANWITGQMVQLLNRLAAEGIPADDELPD